MTSKRYRSRFRSYRNVGFACCAVSAAAWVLCMALDASTTWVVVTAFLTTPSTLIGLTALLGYYVTGFTEDA